VNSPASNSGPVRAVVIDDTDDLRELLRLALTRGGLEVVGEAADGLAGIEAVRAERPDVVLLDLSMPVMDGLEALPSIRGLVPAAKIIVLSGFGATQMSERALAGGADGYLQKGMSLKQILEYVRGMVDATTDQPTPTPALTLVPPAAREQGVTRVAPDAPATGMTLLGAEQGIQTQPRPEDAEPSTQPDVSAWDALAMAPYGVLEVADEPLFRIVHANPTAQRLFENRARFGVPLATIAPALSNLVAFHRLDTDASFVAEVGGIGVHATVRRAERSLIVYLDSTAEDLGVLRRAIATTAHEIRGPVSVLCGIAESIIAEGDTMTEEQRTRLMSSVTRQARVLDGITADLLTAAELQRGSLRLDPQPVEPIGVIDSVIRDRSPVTVHAVVQDDRTVLADPMRLEQMLANLVDNALKYGRAPYVVGVRPHVDDEKLVAIEVTDNGDGVPEEFRGQLFREFTRAGGTIATGTGLGLYVVRSLAEAQGGSVSYATSASGGARFTLVLPAV
jgi:signal transduction histidine kinase/ActR/RegA family two-component response regulator